MASGHICLGILKFFTLINRPSFVIQIKEFSNRIFIYLFIFAEIQRERRELVTQIVTATTKPSSGPQGGPGLGRLNNKTRPGVQEDSEPFNPDNPYHVRTGVRPAPGRCLTCNATAVVLLLKVSNERLGFS